MNQKQAVKTLERLADERDRAHATTMDWIVDTYTHDEITEARHVLAQSKKPASKLLSKKACLIFESEWYGRMPAKIRE